MPIAPPVTRHDITQFITKGGWPCINKFRLRASRDSIILRLPRLVAGINNVSRCAKIEKLYRGTKSRVYDDGSLCSLGKCVGKKEKKRLNKKKSCASHNCWNIVRIHVQLVFFPPRFISIPWSIPVGGAWLSFHRNSKSRVTRKFERSRFKIRVSCKLVVYRIEIARPKKKESYLRQIRFVDSSKAD